MMLKKYKLLWLSLLIFSLEALVYARANATIDNIGSVFTECARNSGRVSAAINLILLLMLGYYGLKEIHKSDKLKNTFRMLFVLFAVNHLIHFYFVSQNLKYQSITVDILHNFHGFITYILIAALPILLYVFKDLSKPLYLGIIMHLFNVTYMIADTFYGRIKPVDPAYLHQIGILIMIVALVYILFRVYKENKIAKK